MKRVLWLTFGALALLAAAVLFQSGSAGDAVARTEPVPPPSALPDVRVKHELIEIPARPPRTSLARGTERSTPVAKQRSQVSPGVDSRPDVIRTAHAPKEVEAPDRRANLLVRAGRAIAGDGKYRPEPFPRIKKD